MSRCVWLSCIVHNATTTPSSVLTARLELLLVQQRKPFIVATVQARLPRLDEAIIRVLIDDMTRSGKIDAEGFITDNPGSRWYKDAMKAAGVPASSVGPALGVARWCFGVCRVPHSSCLLAHTHTHASISVC